MKWKAFLGSSLAVFVAALALDYLIHTVILRSAYEALRDLWRADLEAKQWIMVLVTLIWSVLLTLIFSKGYEARGAMEGARFGLIIGLFTAVPMAYGTYATMPIPYSLALQWFLYTTAECIILGVLLALLYGRLGGEPVRRT